MHCICLRIVVSNKYCVVFLSLVYPMFPFTLDSPFLIAPSVFSNVYITGSIMGSVPREPTFL